MSETCPTVTVMIDGKPVRINQSDYDADPKNYTLTDDAAPAAPAPAPVTPATGFTVAKDGKSFYVVGADGAKIVDVAGIDAAGYKTDADAWGAIMAQAGAQA